MTNLTLKEAKRLSIIKWEYLVDHPLTTETELMEHFPEINNLDCLCGLCEMYRSYDSPCSNCQLSDGADVCCKEYLKFSFYNHTNNIRWARYWAKKLLERIKAIEVD